MWTIRNCLGVCDVDSGLVSTNTNTLLIRLLLLATTQMACIADTTGSREQTMMITGVPCVAVVLK